MNKAAYAKAQEFNRVVNDVGGKANRAIGLFSGRDPATKNAAMIASSLQKLYDRNDQPDDGVLPARAVRSRGMPPRRAKGITLDER